uniref:Tc1-mariner class transposase n=1 Tax=Mycena chlorophos TaxID=658473 RepID=A0ABQ0L1N4_MYCCL|nr:Tc1-mariner class transposase [Mycena chlorophos]
MKKHASADLKARIPILFYDQGLTVPDICEVLGVKKYVVYTTLTYFNNHGLTHNPYGRRHGQKRMLAGEDVSFIGRAMEHQRGKFLDEVRDELHAQRGVYASIPTIQRTIKRMGLTRKVMSAPAIERDELRRSLFMNRIGRDVPDPNCLIFLDESAHDQRTAYRRRGYALRGMRCLLRCHFVRGTRYSILPALSLDGIIAYDIIEGSVTAERFEEFLREFVMPLTNPYPGPRSVLILDNCRIHHADSIRKLIEEDNCCKLIFLPPYSPDLNPIEQAFSAVKAFIRRHWQDVSLMKLTAGKIMLLPPRAHLFFLSYIMSDDSPDPIPPTPNQTKLLIELVKYKETATVGRGGKATTKRIKDVRKKPFAHEFLPSEENFQQLLDGILTTHEEGRYTGTVFPFKVQVPPAKKTEAVDIENSADFAQLASDIIENEPDKIFVFADMSDVVECWKQRGSRTTSSDRAATSDTAPQSEAAPETELELGLAWARSLLLKKWRKDPSSEVMIYVGPEGNVQLTPQQARDWAMAIHAGEATVNCPPNLPSFDKNNRKVALHPDRAHLNATPVPASDPLGHVATIITSLTAMVGNRTPATPQTPRRLPTSSSPIPPTSPPINTPSKLRAYLVHARDKLGVLKALDYHDALALDGYGPDILHKVDAEKLTRLGISAGDAIRLQDGAQAWWNSPEAKKRKRDNSISVGSSALGSHTRFPQRPRWAFDVAEPDKPFKVAFSVESPSGRLARYARPSMEIGEGWAELAYTKYLDENTGLWLPIPPGYAPTRDTINYDDEDDHPFFNAPGPIDLFAPSPASAQQGSAGQTMFTAADHDAAGVLAGIHHA